VCARAFILRKSAPRCVTLSHLLGRVRSKITQLFCKVERAAWKWRIREESWISYTAGRIVLIHVCSDRKEWNSAGTRPVQAVDTVVVDWRGTRIFFGVSLNLTYIWRQCTADRTFMFCGYTPSIRFERGGRAMIRHVKDVPSGISAVIQCLDRCHTDRMGCIMFGDASWFAYIGHEIAKRPFCQCLGCVPVPPDSMWRRTW
jgi:hypothetical protein